MRKLPERCKPHLGHLSRLVLSRLPAEKRDLRGRRKRAAWYKTSESAQRKGAGRMSLQAVWEVLDDLQPETVRMVLNPETFYPNPNHRPRAVTSISPNHRLSIPTLGLTETTTPDS